MSVYLATAKVNLKMLILVSAITLVLGAALFVGHRYRVQVLTQNARVQGLAAYDRTDWPEAAKYLKLYLNRYPEDVEILRKYARAQETISPRTGQSFYTAIDAYRRIVRLKPADVESYQRLTDLYEQVGNYTELVFVAQRRLRHVPGDVKAKFQLANAYLQLHNTVQARPLLLELVSTLEPDPSRKHKELSEICRLLGGIDSQSDDPETRARAADWLDRAVTYLPDSPTPYLNRARFYRLSPSIDPQKRKLALKDLEIAESKENEDPRICLELCYEWIKHRRFDSAAGQLQKADHFSSEAFRLSFSHEEDFLVMRYLLASELAQQTGTLTQGSADTAATLARLTDKGRRLRVLPSAIRIYVRAGQPDDARKCLDEYLALRREVDPSEDSPENIIFLKSLVDGSQGLFYRVIENIEPVARRDSVNTAMWSMLADAYLQTGQTRRAIGAMTRYCAIRPEDRTMALRLARSCFDAHQWQKAYTLATQLRTRDPQNNAAVLLSVQAGLELMMDAALPSSSTIDPASMAHDLEQIQKADPKNVEIRLARADLAFKQQGFELARQILLQAVEQCSDPLPAEIRLVELYRSNNKIKEARILGRRLCNKHPGRVEVWLTLADLYQANHQYQSARQMLGTALEKISENTSRQTLEKRLAILEILHQDRPAGLAMLKKIAQSNQADLQTRTAILSMPEIYKNPDEAQKLVDEIRRIEGVGGLLWRLNQSSLWLNTGRGNEKRGAITQYLSRCIEADPEWSEPIILLGRMHERLGDPGSAESLYRRVLSSKPAMVDVQDELISLLEKQQRYVEALEMMNSLHRLADRAGTRRIRILVKSRNVQQAIDELRFQIANHPGDINSRLLLARLTWQELNDVPLAMTCLDEIDKVMPNALAALALRVAILRAAGQQGQALALLDQAVKMKDTFEVRLVRATFLANIGRIEEAEESFIHLTSLDKNGQSYELLGKFYADHRSMDKAIEAWRQGTRVCPSNFALQRRLIKALLLSGSSEDKRTARTMLDELEKEFPNDLDLLWVRALILLDENNASQQAAATRLIQRIVQMDPQVVHAHLKLIEMANESFNYTRARDLALRGLAANPESPELLLARARSEKLNGNDRAALEMARLVLDRTPAHADAMKLILECALSTNDREGLRNMQIQIRLARNADPGSEQLCLLDAQTSLILGSASEAIEVLETFDRQNPSPHRLGVILTLAELYRKEKDFNRADQYLRQATELAPFVPAVVRERIHWLGDQGDYDRIIEEITAYLNRPDHDPATVALAAGVLGVSRNVAHQARSLIWLQEATTAEPGLIDAQLQLGWLAFESHQFDLAEKTYRTVLTYKPSNLQAINNLAWILSSHKQDFQSALTMANQGLDVSPDHPDLLDTRASIFARMPSKLRQARQDYQRCLELLPADSANAAEVMLKLSDVCIRLKDYSQARDYLDRAREIDRKKKVFTGSQRMEFDRLNNTVASAMHPK